MKLYVDFPFKKLFGSRGNERILIAFLNAMLDKLAAAAENEQVTENEV